MTKLFAIKRHSKYHRLVTVLFGLLLVFQTPNLYAALPPLVKPELNLNPTEQTRIADYIRECEIDREVSQARADALQLCRGPETVADVLSHTLIVSVLLALVTGYAIGRSDR